jgi:hypothetical protein
MIRKLKDGVEYVNTMVVALVKVGNDIKVGNANTTSVVPELINVALARSEV